MNQEREALTVPVIGPNGESLAEMKPARVRRYLDSDRAVVASTRPFTVRLLERSTLMQPTQVLNRRGGSAHAYMQPLTSTLIKNVSGGVVRIADLRVDKDDDGLVLEPGVAIDLRQFYPLEKIQGSRDLRRALFPQPLEEDQPAPAPVLIQLSGLDDPALDAETEGEVLRDRVEKEIKKPLVRGTGRTSPGRGGATPMVTVKGRDASLDQDVQQVINEDGIFDRRMKEVVEAEEALNDLEQAGHEVV